MKCAKTFDTCFILFFNSFPSMSAKSPADQRGLNIFPKYIFLKYNHKSIYIWIDLMLKISTADMLIWID